MEDKNGHGMLYLSKLKDIKSLSPKKLNNKINLKGSSISGACFAENGQAIYFSSNRPGGFGGFDLYVSRMSGSDWQQPENLGPLINSPYDEITPFVLADEKTLYFSSNGHNTMGGMDVFISILNKNKRWAPPQNMAPPINTPYNEVYYVQQANQKNAYFSSDRELPESIGQQDLISVFKVEKDNPMAIVKGVITAEKLGVKEPVTLDVFDAHSNEKQKYVYNPEETTGKYFMILKPKSNYKVHIHIGEGKSRIMNIDIPEDVYSLTINKHINLKPIVLYNKVIDNQMEVIKDSLAVREVDDVENSLEMIKYDALVELMDRIVDSQDALQLEYLNDLDKQVRKPDTEGPDIYYTPLLNRVEEVISYTDREGLLKLGKPAFTNSAVFMGDAADGKQLIDTYKAIISQDGQIKIIANFEQQPYELRELLQKHRTLKLELSYAETSEGVARAEPSYYQTILKYFRDTDLVSSHQIIESGKKSGLPPKTVEIKLFTDTSM